MPDKDEKLPPAPDGTVDPDKKIPDNMRADKVEAEAEPLEDGSPPTDFNIARLNELRGAKLGQKLTGAEEAQYKKLKNRPMGELSADERVLYAQLDARMNYKALDEYKGKHMVLDEPIGTRMVGGHYITADGRHVNAEGKPALCEHK